MVRGSIRSQSNTIQAAESYLNFGDEDVALYCGVLRVGLGYVCNMRSMVCVMRKHGNPVFPHFFSTWPVFAQKEGERLYIHTNQPARCAW